MSELPEKANEMFCFAIYSAAHSINRTYTPLLRPLGLTYPQYITLTLLWEHDGRTVGQLANLLGMETSTLTPLLKRLEKLGHIERRRGTEDERQVFVHLTSTGRKLKRKSPGITECLIEGTGFELPELEELVSSLSRLRDNLEEYQQN